MPQWASVLRAATWLGPPTSNYVPPSMATNWSRRDFDVTSCRSAAADWSRTYIGYLGCFNVKDLMLRISVPVD